MMTATIDGALIGESLPMLRLKELIRRVAASELPVLIQGETGTGKELVASAIHNHSGRSGPLIALNVCALGEALFEASLFGHVRGAFTGAVRDASGFMTEAHRGTLFMDEVSGLPMSNQAKLLRAVETKVFRPVGGRNDQRSDFRLVTATNEPIARMVELGRFRPDLAHRLSGIRLVVPPLRERLDDIPLLFSHFAKLSSNAQHSTIAMSTNAMTLLRNYEWPGNVREFRNVVEATIVLSSGHTIDADDVARLIRTDAQDGAGPHAPSRREFRDRELLDHLERYAWEINEVARVLGVHRATIYRRLRRLGVAPRWDQLRA